MTVLRLILLVTIGMMTVACGNVGNNNISAATPFPTFQAFAELTATSPPARLTELAVARLEDTSNVGAYATPVIEFAGLDPGVARAYALATDIAMSPELENPMTFDKFPVPITFSEFYSGYDLRTGLVRSELLESLDGQQVVIDGYVAPPLKPLMDFFVLTRFQVAYCPFCSSTSDWSTDMLLVYMPKQDLISSVHPVRVTGQLEVGAVIDAETGMVSLIRIYAETIETLD
ncbi:MAG: hypothetical protein AAF846_01985 [Chloroflexota bacterium]